jgi:ABC-type transport system substrate-binding protein
MNPDQRSNGARALAAAAFGALALAACGGGSGLSVSTPTSTSTSTTPTTLASTSTTSTTVPTPPTTSGPNTAQKVTFGGVQFGVPVAWPVYTLASDPTRCVRQDVHAVYLGQEGPNPSCPPNIVGHTEAVHVEPLNVKSQPAAARATQALVLNGLNVRIDPAEQIAGAITAVFPDQQLVVTITFARSSALADEIFQSFAHAA